MKANIRTKNVKLTDSMKLHIDTVINQLEKYNFNVHHFDVVIKDNAKKNTGKFEIEFFIKVDYKKDLIVLKNKDVDFHNCVTVLAKKSEKRLRRLHLKKVDKKNNYKEEAYERIEEFNRID